MLAYIAGFAFVVLTSAGSAQFGCATGSSTGPCDMGPCIGEQICVTLSDGSLGCCPGDNLTFSCPTVATSATASICVDLLNPVTGVSDCPSRSSLCTDATYLSVMQVQCRKTCGFCGSSGSVTVSSCIDQVNLATSTSDCPARVSLCNDSAYSSLMRTQCPKTCGFC
ncbi:unnamed protein product, partial [Mesorhabditis spiculigera]